MIFQDIPYSLTSINGLMILYLLIIHIQTSRLHKALPLLMPWIIPEVCMKLLHHQDLKPISSLHCLSISIILPLQISGSAFFMRQEVCPIHLKQMTALRCNFLHRMKISGIQYGRADGNTKKGFKTAIIPINEPRYLKKGFRFRFVNYASLSSNLTDPSMVGNCDIWNIDYILLDMNRNGADTIYRDVAFRLAFKIPA